MKRTRFIPLACSAIILGTAISLKAIPVTFSVDMTRVAGFNSSSDLVDVRGTFNGWSGGWNLVPSANTNILTNTFEIGDLPGTAEFYKFTWNSNYELQGVGDRP